MGMWTRGIAGVAGVAVGLAVLATGPAGGSWGALALRENGPLGRLIDGARHEPAPTDREIVIERVVPASRSDCWALWTTGEGVGRFLTRHNTVELGIGAPYEIYFNMEAPKGERGSEDCRILSYLPERMLSFEWNAPPHFPEVRQKRSRVVILFEDVAEGTRVRLNHVGFGEGEQWDGVYDYFSRAWPTVMDRFSGSLEG